MRRLAPRRPKRSLRYAELDIGLFVPSPGFALLGFPNAPLPPSLLSMGQSVNFAQPASAGFHGVRFDIQGIGLQLSGPFTGGFTNIDRNRLRFD